MDLHTFLVFGFITTSSFTLNADGNTQSALQKASVAFYHQSGLNVEMKQRFRKYKKMMPEPVQYHLANGAILVRAIAKREISYTWEF